MTTEAMLPTNLYRALHNARKSMGIVAKGGHNKFDKYDYATLQDYIDVIQKPLDENGLICVSDILNIEWLDDRATKQGGSEKVCRIMLKTSVIHAESGESMSVSVLGEGQDRGDKAFYKADTGARKYALANLFNLATGDDPETDSHEPAENPFRREQQKREPPAKATEAAKPAAKPDAEAEKRKAEMKGWPVEKVVALVQAATDIGLLEWVVDGAEGGDAWGDVSEREQIIAAVREQLASLFKTLPATSRKPAQEEAFKAKMKRHVDKLALDKQFGATEAKFEQEAEQHAEAQPA